MIRTDLSAAALVALLAFATQAHAQYEAFGTLGLTGATLPKPYLGSCFEERSELIGVRGGLGIRRGSLELGAGLLLGTELETVADCDVVPAPRPDGVHTFRSFDEAGQNTGLRAATGTAGFALPFAPMIVAHVGGGIELQTGDPIFTYGVAWRTSTRPLRLVVGLQVMELGAPYTRVQQTWQSGQVVAASEVGQGTSWRRSLALNIGGEFRFAGDHRGAGGSR